MAKSVADLKPGEKGIIRGFGCKKHILKLLEMGCLPDSEVMLKFKAPFRGPFYISVEGNEIAIRRGVARNILLYPKK